MTDQDGDFSPKSKTQLKKESLELQKLGERLVSLNKEQLASLKLPQDLETAIQEAQRLKSHEAIRRQFQYIGKLIRKVDIQPIQEYLGRLSLQSQQSVAELHRLEHWRETLLLGNSEDFTRFLTEHPRADRQHLKQLINNARREQESSKPKGAKRALFHYLRELHQRKNQEHD